MPTAEKKEKITRRSESDTSFINESNEPLLSEKTQLGKKIPGSPFLIVLLTYMSLLTVVALVIATIVWAIV